MRAARVFAVCDDADARGGLKGEHRMPDDHARGSEGQGGREHCGRGLCCRPLAPPPPARAAPPACAMPRHADFLRAVSHAARQPRPRVSRLAGRQHTAAPRRLLWAQGQCGGSDGSGRRRQRC
eukprot:7001785-Prymnesium_polylepis.2